MGRWMGGEMEGGQLGGRRGGDGEREGEKRANLPPLNFGRPFVKTVCPMLSERCPICLLGCDVIGVLWPKCRMDQDET